MAITAAAQLGGTERVLLDFANRAFEHDLRLTVLTPVHGPLVEILNKIGVPAEVVPAPERLLRASQRAGARRSLMAALRGTWQWARLLAAHRAVRESQVVYTVAYKAHLAAAAAGLRPTVWHLHEFPPDTFGTVWRLLARARADGIIANSRGVGRAWAAGIGLGREPAVVLNGVNLDRFTPRERSGWIHQALGVNREARLIGMPAVFARWKGQLQVLDAFEQVQGDLPDVHLVLVGGSIYDTMAEREYGEQLGREIARRTSRAGGRVHLLPFQREVEHVYPEFDVVVHYSLRPEAFGRVVVEAMACGTPVIAAGEGGPVEILGASGDARQAGGWLVEPRSPEKLGMALHRALTLGGDALREIGDAGRRRAEDLFSARRFAREVAEVLRGRVQGEGGRVW